MRARAAGCALAAVAVLAAHVLAAPAAMAIAPPVIDPGALPAAGTPGPAEEMRQSEACITPVVIADPNVTQPAPGNAMLDVTQAWQYSTGAGVLVAIIDTGVTPNPRFPALFAGGDYVQGLPNGGLTDCDNHGSVVASIIAAAPWNPGARPAPQTRRRGRTAAAAGRAGQSRTDQRTAATTTGVDGDGDRATTAAATATAGRWPRLTAPRMPAPANRWCPVHRRAPRTGWWGWPLMPP